MVVAMSVAGWFGVVLAAAIWIALAFWPARVAGRKGHSFLLYFIFSLFFFPAALIVAYVAVLKHMAEKAEQVLANDAADHAATPPGAITAPVASGSFR